MIFLDIFALRVSRIDKIFFLQLMDGNLISGKFMTNETLKARQSKSFVIERMLLGPQ
jgi:hypothetical protein